jgi:hypothetical protein
MTLNNTFIYVAVGGLLLGGYIGYRIAPKPDHDRIERLERRAFYDSATIAGRETQINGMFSYIDSLEKRADHAQAERYKWLVKWDTVYIRELAEQQKDTTVRQALEDCITADRFNNATIHELEKIGAENHELIGLLNDQLKTYERQTDDLNNLLIEYRSGNEYLVTKNRHLRTQRNISWIALVVAGVTIYLMR